MLQHLEIHNYALIKDLSIDLSDGFSVITGETGAGKSIILGALGLLSGQRADAKIIKTGEKKCVIEGIFNIKALQLESWFEENDIDYDENECALRREINASGKSRAFINDTPTSLALLKSLSNKLFDIHSQHQNLLIANESFLVDTLDTIAQDHKLVQDYKKAFQDWHEEEKTLEQLKKRYEENKQNADYLQFLLQQLSEAQLQEDELPELEQEYKTLSHAEDIKQNIFSSIELLNNDENNTIAHLRSCYQNLQSISSVYPQAATLAERLEASCIEIEDIYNELESLQDNIEFDPERRLYIEERLNLIYGLQKKFNLSGVKELLDKEMELRTQLDELNNIDYFIGEQEKKVKHLFEQVIDFGKKVTAARKKAAQIAEEEIASQLRELGMPFVKLHFQFIVKKTPQPTGLDDLQFLFSANKNIPEQDISQTASGGEIARLMLTLKELISRKCALPTIIFDEIDTGVSGKMAEKMGKVMLKMSENCQVLCITHLPQIAALGKQHYKVFKEESQECTTSKLAQLNAEARIDEIANMLSGVEITAAAINNAKTLLKINA